MGSSENSSTGDPQILGQFCKIYNCADSPAQNIESLKILLWTLSHALRIFKNLSKVEALKLMCLPKQEWKYY